MPTDQHGGNIESFVQLPPALSENVNVQQALRSLEVELRSAGEVIGCRDKITILLRSENEESAQNPRPALIEDHTPTAWYNSEDQMTHGGKPEGVIWNDDDRVF